MKTILELNSKWWYRLVKVIYFFIILISIAISSMAIFYSYSPEYDNSKSYIKCANGKKFVLSENHIFLTEQRRQQLDGIVQQMVDNKESDDDIQFVVDDFKQKYSKPDKNMLTQDQIKEKVKNLCFNFSATRIKFENGQVVSFDGNPTPQDIEEVALKLGTKPVENYELVSVYTKRNWIATVGFSILSVIGILLVSELMRRIFYYVVLGSIKPKK